MWDKAASRSVYSCPAVKGAPWTRKDSEDTLDEGRKWVCAMVGVTSSVTLVPPSLP
ncbi:hypothetical protein SERLADRAFT_379391, partial [Serpula lacrymans var. lacrymans S7.9]